MKKAILKFNGGLGAVLCSKCSRIIRSGGSLTKEDREALKGMRDLEEQFCGECSNKVIKRLKQ